MSRNKDKKYKKNYIVKKGYKPLSYRRSIILEKEGSRMESKLFIVRQ